MRAAIEENVQWMLNKAASRSQQTSITAGDTQPIIPGNGSRIRLIISTNLTAFQTTAAMDIGPRVNGVVVPITRLSANLPTVVLRVEDYGDILLGQLFGFCVASNQILTIWDQTLRRE